PSHLLRQDHLSELKNELPRIMLETAIHMAYILQYDCNITSPKRVSLKGIVMTSCDQYNNINFNSRSIFGALQYGDDQETQPILVKALTAIGCIAEGCFGVAKGNKVKLLLRNIGWAEG